MRRDRIRARPRTFYTNLLERLNKIPQEEPAPAFALEHSWHAIFVSASTNAKRYQRPCCRVCSRGAFPGCILKLARVLQMFCTPALAGPNGAVTTALQGEPWVTLGIGKCQLIHCRWACAPSRLPA